MRGHTPKRTCDSIFARGLLFDAFIATLSPSPFLISGRTSSTRSTAGQLLGLAWGLALLLVIGAPTSMAFAQDAGAPAVVTRLNKEALDAFDNLNFEQAKALLEQALAQSEAAHLGDDPVSARTHLNLGMVFIAGFQRREQAIEQFKVALRIQPDIAAPAGLFNPEAQAAFDEVKGQAKPAAGARPGTQPSSPADSASARPASGGRSTAGAASSGSAETAEGSSEGDDDEEDGGASAKSGSRILLSVGLGSGFGIARGKLDANRDLDSDGNGTADNQWTGGVAPSRLGHLSLAAGYFLSPRLMLSLEGRLQVITGTTIVKGAPQGNVCVPSCSPPSTGFALFGKAHWFLADGPLRPFVSGGLGVGSIRQVVKLTIQSGAGQPAPQTGCGDSQTATCVDTVTGGPFWLAAGGGLAYEIGSLALLGSLTANVGMSSFMFNVDALFGLGLRL
jgi:tetratricopeptide (TPR) repeat protein